MCVCVCDVDDDVFTFIPNMPDIIVVGGGRREVLILEVGCSFDSYMEQAFTDKFLKYALTRLNSLGCSADIHESRPCT